jgi:shikimate kinase/3-dehydroquinate synthase
VEAIAAGGSAAGSAAGAGARALVFVGFMGAGKSSAARAVAAELGVRAVDSDRELEQSFGEPIEAFFDRHGEAAFREREEAVVLELLGSTDAHVVALGGGALGSERVRAALERHVVVHLEVDLEDAWRRASGRGRPLARDRAGFEELYRRRSALYARLADATLPAADRGAPRRALAALSALRERPAGDPPMRLVWALSASGDYPVLFGRGLLGAELHLPLPGRRFLVADRALAGLSGPVADWRLDVEAGERAKTLAGAEVILREMARAEVTRGDAVVAFGGGVIGDLAGFCAAVYARGVPCVQVPTTLVAQVDSAYGGKTGVDLPEGKNLVGAFHQPAAVLVDPGVLAGLPASERAAGYAEVVKTALIAGGPLWSRVREGAAPDDEDVIWGCLRTKLGVVSEDERDGGRRQVLNLGHTVGHALEAATGYALRHGEAVALGLLCALRLSGRDGLRSEVATLLAAQGLPLAVEGTAVDEVVARVGRDKKRQGEGAVPFVLVEAPGAVTPGHEVPDRDLRAALAEVLG